MKPYSDLTLSESFVIRTFDETIDPVELMWHRDNEDRQIEAVGETDWLFQREDSLPQKMVGIINIPKHEWHRVIKGTGPLVIKLLK